MASVAGSFYPAHRQYRNKPLSQYLAAAITTGYLAARLIEQFAPYWIGLLGYRSLALEDACANDRILE